MAGYVCIPRSIMDSWIWKNPEYLKWYLDLVMMAAFRPCSISTGRKIVAIERGQLVGSIGELSKRWGKGTKIVRHFIEQLSKDGKISRYVVAGKIVIITIQNYSLADKVEEIMSNDNKEKGQALGTKNGQKRARSRVRKGASSNDCETDECDNEWASTMPTSRLCIGQCTGECSSPSSIYKGKIINNKSDEEENNAHTHTHEGKHEEVALGEISDDDKTVLEELKGNETFLENVCMKHHLASVNVARRYVDGFALELANYNKTHNNRQELIRHFQNWLYKQIKEENKEQVNKNTMTYENNRQHYESPVERQNRIDQEQIEVGMRAMAYFEQKRNGNPQDLREYEQGID